MHMSGKFVITKDRRGEYRFALKATNGQTIAVSEGYTSKANALKGVESVRSNAKSAAVVDETENA
jgi:uncharacterized protein YegP (UPF0339 family)